MKASVQISRQEKGELTPFSSPSSLHWQRPGALFDYSSFISKKSAETDHMWRLIHWFEIQIWHQCRLLSYM